MKRKFSRILGVGLSLMLLASLLVVATPVSAGTLSWSAETIPSATDKVIETSIIIDYAIASDGKTIYAVLTGNKLYKSTDGGLKWTALTSPSANTSTLVAIAPGNDNMVVVVGTTALGALENVWITVNAGSSWTSLGTPADAAGTVMTTASAVAISPAVAGVTNIAVGGAIGGAPAVSYFNYGAVITRWVNATRTAAADNWTANIGPATAVRAVAFSPSFASDRVMGVVTENNTGVVLFQIASFNTKTWNAGVSGYTGYPVPLVLAGVSALTADLEFAPSYLGADTTSRIVFIGTTETGGANAPGGIYRLEDTEVKLLKKAITGIKSVAYNAAATKLVAGESGNNAVWRSTNPLATTPSVITTGSTYKKPGVDGKTANVIVAWSGTDVLAGSGGADGGFSISKNDGTTFNDVSLVTTAMTNIVDVAITANASHRYLLTNDGADMSVWRYVTAWERVRAFTTASQNYIIRLAPEDGNVVYLADTGTTTIWQSTNGGETWTNRFSTVNIQDLAVESASAIYVAEAGTKNVVKSTNSGFTWSDTPLDTKLAGGNNYMLASIAKDQLVVGSTTGYVAYSADGGTTWTAISAVTIAGNVQVTADKLTTGGFIYAATSGATGDVRRLAIGGTSWTDITSGVTGNSTGIGLSGGVLYVISTNSTDSSMYRELAPSTATSTTIWSSVNSTGVFDRPPQALKLTTGPKLWAVNTEGADTLQSLSDTVSTSKTVPAITAPADLTRVSVNPQTGLATDVVYQWSRLSSATAYELQIAYDSAFTQLITKRVIISSEATVVTVIGPSSAGIADAGSTGTLGVISYQPNTTYYWRVRASAPLYSAYSTTRSIVTGTAVAFEIASPAVGATDVSVKPTLVWTEYAGAINYEIEISTDSTFATLDESRTTLTTFFKLEDEALAHSTTYYWRVRGVTQAGAIKTRAPGGPWLNGIFITEAKPVEAAPPIVIEPTPPAEVKIVEVPVTTVVPAAIPSYLLWAIIVIGAVLIIALIVLIVRTRRVA